MLNAYSWAGLVAIAVGLAGCAESPRQAAEDLKGDLSNTGGDGDGDDSDSLYPDDSDDDTDTNTNTGDGDTDTGDGDGDGDGSEFSPGGSSVDAGAGNPFGGLGGLFGGGGLGGGAKDGGTATEADAGECESSPRVCIDIFDCYLFHPGDLGCGYTKCEGLVCKK